MTQAYIILIYAFLHYQEKIQGIFVIFIDYFILNLLKNR